MHSHSGLNLTRTRAYSANLGRFISRDPIGERGGVNLYGYVGGNPVSLTDPSGTSCIPEGWSPPPWLCKLIPILCGAPPPEPRLPGFNPPPSEPRLPGFNPPPPPPRLPGFSPPKPEEKPRPGHPPRPHDPLEGWHPNAGTPPGGKDGPGSTSNSPIIIDPPHPVGPYSPLPGPSNPIIPLGPGDSGAAPGDGLQNPPQAPSGPKIPI